MLTKLLSILNLIGVERPAHVNLIARSQWKTRLTLEDIAKCTSLSSGYHNGNVDRGGKRFHLKVASVEPLHQQAKPTIEAPLARGVTPMLAI